MLEVGVDIHPSQIDWESQENYFAANPRLQPEIRGSLLGLLAECSLKGHLFLLSSGTSSGSQAPHYRWIALSLSSFVQAARSLNARINASSKDRWLNPLPIFHVGGLAIWARATLSGAQVFSFADQGPNGGVGQRIEWNPTLFSKIVDENQISLTSLVPTQIFDLIKKASSGDLPHYFKSLRTCFVGGAALSPFLYSKSLELGLPVVPSYGMTETSAMVACDFDGKGLQPLPGVYLRTGDCIEVKSPGLLTGFLERIDGRVQLRDPKKEGWFETSDDGNFCSQAGLKVFGRKGMFVKIGGEGIEFQTLGEIIEKIRLDLKIEADLAVAPVPDERLGNKTCLFSDSRLSAEQASEVRELFSKQVLPIAKIHEWHLMDAVPRNALGKLVVPDCVDFALKRRPLYGRENLA